MMTAKASHESTIWREYDQLDYRKAVKNVGFLRHLPGRLAIGWRRRIRVRTLWGGYWRGFNPLDRGDWRKRRAYRNWRKKWGL